MTDQRDIDNGINKLYRDMERQTAEEKSTMTEDCLREADALVGTSGFPALCREIVQAENNLMTANDSLKNVFFRRAYLFFVDKGRGYNSALLILKNLLRATGLFSIDFPVIPFSFYSLEDLKMDPLKTDNSLRNDNTIISFDLSSIPVAVDSPQMPGFLIHLRELTKRVKNVLVFRFPYMEEREAQNIIRMFNWFFTVKPVFFQPFTDDDILDMAKGFFGTMNYKMERSARSGFLDMVYHARDNGYFFGSHTVRKLVDDVVSEQLATTGNAKKIIGKAEILASAKYIKPQSAKNAPATMDQTFVPLDNMVGMEEISNEVKNIVRSILYTRATGQASISLHMVLTGNPGTGKTTVARVIAAALKSSGVLSVGKCVEGTAADLIGQYVGQSAPQTRDVCTSAYGSVLFIDEAYTLASKKSGNTFGEEALAELISQMENHRDDFVVIMAGYAEDMEEMLKINAGMKRRLSYRIDIPPCNSEQLFAIYMQQLKSRKKQAEEKGYKLDWDDLLMQSAEAYFNSIPEQVIMNKAFGNGGYARNLVEKTIANAVARCSNNSMENIQYDLLITTADFENASKQVKQI